jgi:hypothetical protein
LLGQALGQGLQSRGAVACGSCGVAKRFNSLPRTISSFCASHGACPARRCGAEQGVILRCLSCTRQCLSTVLSRAHRLPSLWEPCEMMAAADSPDLGALLTSDDEDDDGTAPHRPSSGGGASKLAVAQRPVVSHAHARPPLSAPVAVGGQDHDHDDEEEESGLTGFETMDAVDGPTADDDVIADSQPPSDQPPPRSVHRHQPTHHFDSKWEEDDEVLSQELRFVVHTLVPPSPPPSRASLVCCPHERHSAVACVVHVWCMLDER